MSGPCPSCKGNPREEVDGEVYVCPDCAGSGLVENSITANEKLRDAAPRLADALKAWGEWAGKHQSKLYHGDLSAEGYAELEALVVESSAALREAGVEGVIRK